MKRDETALWKWLKSATLDIESPTDLHMRRVENSIAANMPDVTGTYKGFSFWCELKSLETAAHLHHALRTGQAMWLYSRAVAGCATYVLLEIAGTRRYLLPGNVAVDLTERTYIEPELRDISLIHPFAPPIDCLMAMCGIGQ